MCLPTSGPYHVQHRYDNSVYDESADMIDMFAGYTLDETNADTLPREATL